MKRVGSEQRLVFVNEVEEFRNRWMMKLLRKVDKKCVGEDASTRN